MDDKNNNNDDNNEDTSDDSSDDNIDYINNSDHYHQNSINLIMIRF